MLAKVAQFISYLTAHSTTAPFLMRTARVQRLSVVLSLTSYRKLVVVNFDVRPNSYVASVEHGSALMSTGAERTIEKYSVSANHRQAAILNFV